MRAGADLCGIAELGSGLSRAHALQAVLLDSEAKRGLERQRRVCSIRTDLRAPGGDGLGWEALSASCLVSSVLFEKG